jgi:hypothetical protein
MPEGSKALITSGSTVVGTPMVEADPLALGRPVQSFPQALPVSLGVTQPGRAVVVVSFVGV